MVFIDLENTYNRELGNVIRWSLDKGLSIEGYIRVIKDKAIFISLKTNEGTVMYVRTTIKRHL